MPSGPFRKSASFSIPARAASPFLWACSSLLACSRVWVSVWGGCHLVCPKRHCLSEAQLHSLPLSQPEIEHRYGKIFSTRVFMHSLYFTTRKKIIHNLFLFI